MRKNLGFRAWFYFRQGWTVYFAFILAAINTMVVTYYLAIENSSTLKELFPSFYIYLAIMASIGIPLLILAGYTHFKKTSAYKAEADIYYESNPFALRTLVNSEILVKLNLKLINIIISMSKNETITKEVLNEITQLEQQLLKLTNERTLKNKKDLEFFKNI